MEQLERGRAIGTQNRRIEEEKIGMKKKREKTLAEKGGCRYGCAAWLRRQLRSATHRPVRWRVEELRAKIKMPPTPPPSALFNSWRMALITVVSLAPSSMIMPWIQVKWVVSMRAAEMRRPHRSASRWSGYQQNEPATCTEVAGDRQAFGRQGK
jgi:hypothetical protein